MVISTLHLEMLQNYRIRIANQLQNRRIKIANQLQTKSRNFVPRNNK
jgi:hypothetical protein